MIKVRIISMNLFLLASIFVIASSFVSRTRRIVSYNWNKNNNKIHNNIASSTKQITKINKTITTSSTLPTMKINQSQNDEDGTSTTTTVPSTEQQQQTGQEDKSTTNTKNKIQSKTWNPIRLGVLRLGLTEPSMTSLLNYGKYDGIFTCAYCNHELFDSTAKYESYSGWPSFWRSISNTAIHYKRESNGQLEVQCNNCRSHIGHVFLDGPKPNTVQQDILQSSPISDPRHGPTSKRNNLPRFCMNGAALKYTPRDK